MSSQEKQISVEEKLKNKWIYWGWSNKSDHLFKSYVQDVIDVGSDKILELSDNEFGSNYPQRLLLSSIIWYQQQGGKQ